MRRPVEAEGGGRSGDGKLGVDETVLRARLDELKSEHRDLDAAIAALAAMANVDQLQLARLKKRKLRLRDEIALIEGQLIPDIIA